MLRMHRMIGWALFAAVACAPAFTSDVTSHFDASDENWRIIDVGSGGNRFCDAVAGPVAPDWLASGGESGGCIAHTDIFACEFYFEAPETFLGDQSAKYGGGLYWHLRLNTGAEFDTADVVLCGAGITLVNFDPPQPTGEWESYWVLLQESAGWHIDSLTGPQPTAAEFRAVLSGLSSLRIRGEFIGEEETAYLDSVTLEGPAPCTPVLVSPPAGAVLDNGCLQESDALVWQFDWTDCEAASAYELQVMGPGAQTPLISDDSLTQSEYVYESSMLVTAAELTGWTWSVRALVGGCWRDWTAPGSFDVEPVDTDCATCPGDLNHDGDVDLGDLGEVLSAFGLNGDGDLDGDGDTDLSDLGIVLSAFGGPC